MKRIEIKMTGNDKGFALVLALLVMTAVMIIGGIATRTATTELQIAGYDKFYKKTWYATDGVVSSLIPDVLEIDIAERGFNDGERSDTPFNIDNASSSLNFYVGGFFTQRISAVCENNIPSKENRDIELIDKVIGDTNIYIKIWSEARLAEGNAIQIAEGYHGRGKGIAGGGAYTLYTIRAIGTEAPMGAEVKMTSMWRHMI